MKKCKGFPTFKQRGEWVELKFMAKAAEHGLQVLKPWGDSLAYDVGLDPGLGLLRVQVKSTTASEVAATVAGSHPVPPATASTPPRISISSPPTSSLRTCGT